MWSQTQITWHMQARSADSRVHFAETDIPVSQRRKGDGKFHTCTKIWSVAQPGRSMAFQITLNRGGEMTPPYGGKDTEEVWRRLERLAALQGKVDLHRDTGEWYGLYLPLRNGEQYCEHVFKVVPEIFKLLGIQDPHNCFLGNFAVVQMTNVWQDGHWRPYKYWLRERFNLPHPEAHLG